MNKSRTIPWTKCDRKFLTHLGLRNHVTTHERRTTNNWQFQLLVYACRGRWEVSYHIADYAEKIKIVAM